SLRLAGRPCRRLTRRPCRCLAPRIPTRTASGMEWHEAGDPVSVRRMLAAPPPEGDERPLLPRGVLAQFRVVRISPEDHQAHLLVRAIAPRDRAASRIHIAAFDL